jgi:hypothetical protein
MRNFSARYSALPPLAESVVDADLHDRHGTGFADNLGNRGSQPANNGMVLGADDACRFQRRNAGWFLHHIGFKQESATTRASMRF